MTRPHRSAAIAIVCACAAVVVTGGAARRPALAAGAEGGTATRLPEPDAAARAAARALVRDLFKSDYAAQAPAARAALAKKLMDEAAKAGDDPTGRYVLLGEAADAAAAAGDVWLAMRAVDELARIYRLDAPAVKAATLAAVPRKDPGTAGAAADASLLVSEQALAKEDFDLAAGTAKHAGAAARQANDRALAAEAAAQVRAVEAAKQDRAAAAAAEVKLDANPNDPQANLTVGFYRWFNQGDWAGALPLLAKANGADAKLQALAARELDAPSAPAAMADLAEAWWQWSTAVGGTSRVAAARARSRAVYWYGRALPQLTGLKKAAAERRLAEAGPGGAAAAWISKGATYKQTSFEDARTYPSIPDLINGNGGRSHPEHGFAFHTAKQDSPYIVIDLGAVFRITRIEIENRTEQSLERARTLTVWVGDGKRYWRQVWRADEVQPRWTIDLPRPATSRYVKIGLREFNALHLMSVKMFGERP